MASWATKEEPMEHDSAVRSARVSIPFVFGLALAAFAICSVDAGAHDWPPDEPEDIVCGQTVTPGQGNVVTLHNDIDCSQSTLGVALQLDGPGTLDMNGFSIICTSNPNTFMIGLNMAGRRARATNGTVTNCTVGVSLGDLGRHRVENMAIDRSLEQAISISVSRNRILDTTITGVGSPAGEGTGIIVMPGIGERATNGNIIRNVAVSSADQAVLMEGNRNVLINSTLSNNRVDGVTMNGNRNLVWNNEVSNIADGDGISLTDGQNNVIARNTVTGNGLDGITILGGTSTWIVGNTATDNNQLDSMDPFFGYDLSDGNQDCDANVWRFNTFGTSASGTATSTVVTPAECID